ncbi:MAG TPA: WG repeat-containing protein [Pyrinomonadaceae bacterium]|nr:WG repeat-containing protein [Pyrinomonadaceae bacterium]
MFKIKVNNKYGFIDKFGNIVIEPQFQGVYDFSDGLAKIYTNGEFDTAYIDETGKIAIEPKFDIGSNFSEGFAWVGFDPEKKPYKLGSLTLYSSQGTHSFNYNIGFIDKTGKFITEPIFTFAGNFSEGLAFVRTKDNKFGFIDKSGEFAIQPKFDWADSFSEGLALVFVKGKYGFIDKTGKIVIKPQFTKAESFSEGLAVVKIGGQVREPNLGSQIITTTTADTNYAYIDKTGKIIFKIKAGSANSFSEGLARFEPFGDYKHGFVDKTGKVVIRPTFMGSSDFSEDFASIILEAKDKSFGFIDKTGKIIFETNYHLAGDFKNGLAEIQELNPNDDIVNTKYGYIDKTGKVIWQPTK